MMDMHRCIGCRYCIAACPYGSRSFNWRDPACLHQPEDKHRSDVSRPGPKGVVEKCNFCAERICSETDEEPACVEAVEAGRDEPAGEGRVDLRGPGGSDSEVREALDENHTICRRPESRDRSQRLLHRVRSSCWKMRSEEAHATGSCSDSGCC